MLMLLSLLPCLMFLYIYAILNKEFHVILLSFKKVKLRCVLPLLLFTQKQCAKSLSKAASPQAAAALRIPAAQRPLSAPPSPLPALRVPKISPSG